MKLHILIPLVALACPVAGCVERRPNFQIVGEIPRGRYTMLEAPNGQTASLVASALEGHELRQGDNPNYLVQVTFSSSSAKTGWLGGDRIPREWRRAPRRGHVPTIQFSLSISDMSNGTELYRFDALKRAQICKGNSSTACEDEVSTLIEEMLSESGLNQ